MKLSATLDARLKERAAARMTELDAPAERDDVVDREIVLVVDDESEITQSVAELLDREYGVLTANSSDEAVELLEHNEVSVILADQRMPRGSGAELLARSIDIAPDATRILFTGYSDIAAVVAAINEGHVFYYLTKPWSPEALQALVSRGLERHRLVIENRNLLLELTRVNQSLEERVRERTRSLQAQNKMLKEARARIEALSRRDSLTGLANRSWLDATLFGEVERSRRYGPRLSVTMIDVDRFKSVNDSFGHLVGDRVLQSVATALLKTVRTTDLAGRYGGEEFLVILPNTGLSDACAMAERLRGQVESVPIEFREEPITVSLGVAEWREGDDAAALIQRADEALYEAKLAGRNRVVCHPPTESDP
jgi:two-component system, cell cycle response regulator